MMIMIHIDAFKELRYGGMSCLYYASRIIEALWEFDIHNQVYIHAARGFAPLVLVMQEQS